MSARKDVEVVIAEAYQHFNNGGVTFRLVRLDSIPDDANEKTYTRLFLETSMSNMGITTATRVPVFATTVNILQHFATGIADLGSIIDPTYLQSIDAEVTMLDTATVRYCGPNEVRTGVVKADPEFDGRTEGSKDNAADKVDTDGVDVPDPRELPSNQGQHPGWLASNNSLQVTFGKKFTKG